MQSVNNLVKGKKVTAVTADDTAGYVDVDLGMGSVGCAHVQIVRSGKQLNSDPAITLNQGGGGIVRVGDGSTYAVTAADIIHVIGVEMP